MGSDINILVSDKIYETGTFLPLSHKLEGI